MPGVKGDGMRGLAVFISDIRNCKSKENEMKRINKELANIRAKFRGDKTLDGYQKKKYVCKLLFIFLLGNDIDFGHMEAVNLLSSNKYTEKQIGYLFISVLITETSELMRLVTQSIKNDLQSRHPIHIQLALQCIANIGSPDMAEAFGSDVPRILCSGDAIDGVRQSAALCLLKMIRAAPNGVKMDEFSARVIHLLNDQHMGVVTSAVSLLEVLVQKDPVAYKDCIPLAVSRLSRIVSSGFNDLQDYTYYFVPAPWLSVKLIRLLQCFHPNMLLNDQHTRTKLADCLEAIMNKAQDPSKSKKVQHSNAKNAVLFEAINLIIHMDCDPPLLIKACNQLGSYLQHKETNMRYLAMESMCLLATSEFAHEAIKQHQKTVIGALKSERDVSVRQRAVDLLYAMCDKSNAEEIVSEMLLYLETADYGIREEMVLKIAILAEKYAQDYSWFVDIVLNLIRIAGDFVSEEVWYRVIQIVINREDVQGYAAKMVFEALQAPACHENMVKVGGYILGEYGNLIAGDAKSSPQVQFELLHSKFHLCSLATKGLLLTTYIKFINLFPEIKEEIQAVLNEDAQLRSNDVEIQQRALEYLRLSNVPSDTLNLVLEEMPPFPEKESSILAKLKQNKPVTVVNKDVSDNIEKQREFAEAVKEHAAANPPPAPAPAAAPTNGAADILGLDVGGGDVSKPGADTNGASSLLDILGTPAISTMSPEDQVVENLKNFVYKDSCVLYENDLLQVGIQSEWKSHLGRVTIFYGNKTNSALNDFQTDVSVPHDLASCLTVEAKPLSDTVIPGGQQMQQILNIQYLACHDQLADLRVSFFYSNIQQRLPLKVPCNIMKFASGTTMDGETFFNRWKILGEGNQSQEVFNASRIVPMEIEAIRTVINGLKLSNLTGIDPNDVNFVLAGIINTSSQLVGCLVRLEPSLARNCYRLTVRTNNPVASKMVKDCIRDIL